MGNSELLEPAESEEPPQPESPALETDPDDSEPVLEDSPPAGAEVVVTGASAVCAEDEESVAVDVDADADAAVDSAVSESAGGVVVEGGGVEVVGVGACVVCVA